jgi:pSer/pThr/pTyr-binding forkhead associated (FHA) protein
MSTFPLKPGENLVGRSPECAICIDDPSISRQHAVLIVSSGKILLKDLGSKNHTFIGKSTVTSEVEIPVATMLRFGTVEAEVRCKT